MSNKDPRTLIHAAVIKGKNGTKQYLFLRKLGPKQYIWFENGGENEVETGISSSSIEEAMRLAHKQWKNQSFRTLICGFRYTLPERDEHGNNALFYQMTASYSSPNGIYFDEELGHACLVQNASQEALSLWKNITQ